jgi:GPI mannosyltransferase 2
MWSISQSTCDVLLIRALGSLGNWDAIHFEHVSQHGYSTEREGAFFPLVPYTIASMSSLFSRNDWLCQHASFLLSGAILSFSSFIIATAAMYHLSLHVLGNRHMSSIATLAFVFTPANIFASAIYSESIFAALSFSFMLGLAKGYTNPMLTLASVPLALMCSAARSNAILLSVLCVYYVLQHSRRRYWLHCIPYICCIVALLLPNMLHQYRIWTMVCDSSEAHTRQFCSSAMFVPFTYSEIQRVYWNVGLFRFYEARQIPNMFLAAPTLFLAASVARTLVMKSWLHMPKSAWPFQLYATLQLIVATTILHMHVTTRFMMSSPALYWVLAVAASVQNRSKCVGHWFTMSVLYIGAGTVLFSLFYPWT